MLDDLEANVGKSDTKLSGAMNRMRRFIRETEGMFHHDKFSYKY